MSAANGHRRVQRLIVLPWAASVEIAWRNLRVRFLRNVITVISLVLAVAFLSFTMVNVDLAQGYLQAGGEAAMAHLLRAGYDVDAASGAVGSSPKERWIAVLSLLVCAVGIVNAQLMAVTERFREIGIMKCLGALDSMVLRLFLLEATMQGLAGATIGSLLGGLGAMLLGLFRFGFSAFAGLAPAALLGSLGLAMLAGVGLCFIGVSYPAYVAARMQPVVAMKADL
ncbi:MAG: ABC transporter permease [Desulfovibrio sp.]|nr:ABC transporter permease [Desulfovibrio sp.]